MKKHLKETRMKYYDKDCMVKRVVIVNAIVRDGNYVLAILPGHSTLCDMALVCFLRQQSTRNLRPDISRKIPAPPLNHGVKLLVSRPSRWLQPFTGPLGLPRWCCKFNHLHTWRLHGTPITGRSSGASPRRLSGGLSELRLRVWVHTLYICGQ